MGEVAGRVEGVEGAGRRKARPGPAQEQAAAPYVGGEDRPGIVEFADGVAAVIEEVGRDARYLLPGTQGILNKGGTLL